MVQLDIISGKQAGASTVVRRFPFSIGRAPSDQLQLDDDGIWESHAAIHLASPDGFVLQVRPEARAEINGQSVERALLRSGDVVSLTGVKMQFGLSPVRQRSLRWREAFTWAALAALSLGQVALIYWVLP